MIRIPIKGHRIIKLNVDVLPADVPFLIGIDVLDKYKLYPNTVENKLCGPQLDIDIPLTRKHGHVYLEWSKNERILFTKKELIKLHHNFSHLASDKLLNLLKLAWVTNSRPDISCHVAKLVQVVEESFEKNKHKYIKAVHKIMEQLKNNNDIFLKYPKLGKESLRITSYSDASFATNDDHTSQLGYFIFLSDKYNKCQPIYWTSYKAKRVTRSVLGSKVMALADAFDMAYIIKYDRQNIMNKQITLTMYTDSLSLFDVLTKATMTTEKRLMIDLKAL